MPAWNTVEELRRTSLQVDCEHPNSSIHSFSGLLKFAGTYSGNRDRQSVTRAYTSFTGAAPDSGDAQLTSEVPLSMSNFVLRGSSMRNTRWAVGEFCLSPASVSVTCHENLWECLTGCGRCCRVHWQRDEARDELSQGTVQGVIH
jgi:hypothetical protein